MNDASSSGSIWSSFWTWSFIFSALFCVALISNPFRRSHRVQPANSCIANLKQLDGAKEQWALENKKQPHDTPAWTDLIGTTAYIKNTPRCPVEGIYRLNRADTPPTCSLGKTATPPHVLPQ